MPLIDSASLVFIPEYRFFSVRDYDMYEKSGAREALEAAHTTAVAAGDGEIFVVCAQDELKICLTVSLYDEPVRADRAGWDDTLRFSLPFPTGVLHAGDAFGNVVNMNMPDTGRYVVVLQHAGREEAAETSRREWPAASELGYEQMRDVLDQWAGLERYQVTIYPDIDTP